MKYSNWLSHRFLIVQSRLRALVRNFRVTQSNLSNEDYELKAEREMYDRLNMVSTSLCLAKWMQVTLHLHNGFNQSCHHVKSHKIPLKKIQDVPSSLHNTPFKMKMRSKMLKSSRPAECDYCWAFEDKGRLSDRAFKSTEFSNSFAEVLNKVAKKHILPSNVEVSFDNTCNLKCMYCGPQFSTKWMEESKKFGSYPTSDNHGSLADLKKEGRMPFAQGSENPYIKAFWHWWPELQPNLEVFRITGGEPLLSAHTWRVFETLCQNPNTNLHFSINSNMSLSQALIKKLISNINQINGKIKKFTLFTSVDTFGEQAEYIRSGLNYKEYIQNIEAVLTEVKEPIEISYMITVNALSLAGFPELLKVIYEQRRRFPRHIISFDTPVLRDPKHMSVKILPKDFRTMIYRALTLMKDHSDGPGRFDDREIQRVDRIKTLMETDPYDDRELDLRRKDFYFMYKEYDRRKGTNFIKTFPEYAEFYNSCGQLAEPSGCSRS